MLTERQLVEILANYTIQIQLLQASPFDGIDKTDDWIKIIEKIGMIKFCFSNLNGIDLAVANNINEWYSKYRTSLQSLYSNRKEKNVREDNRRIPKTF